MGKSTTGKTQLKKNIAILLGILAISILAGCGNESGSEHPNSNSATDGIMLPPDEEPALNGNSYKGLVEISEIMVKNKSIFPVPGLGYPDWIELVNISDGDVDISGWVLSTGNSSGEICANGVNTIIRPGEYALVYASSEESSGYFTADISMKPGCTVSLAGPNEVILSSVLCEDKTEDVSFIPNDDGSVISCKYPTPGLANTSDNYDTLMANVLPSGPVVINEVMGGNINTIRCNTGYEDWIELKNISNEDVLLSDYYISDSDSDYMACRLPELVLKSGEYAIVWCSGDSGNTTKAYFHSDFKIDSVRDTIFLSDANRVVDSLSYHDVPAGGSIGHGENGTGVFVFTVPSPKTQNQSGFSRVSTKPECSIPDGLYPDTESVTAELSANGTIYYTVDGSTPSISSTVYSEPIVATDVTIIRAIAVEKGCSPSGETVLSFFVNKDHALPVLSLTVDKTQFSRLYYGQIKNSFAMANLALYENGTVFNSNCGFCMKGWTSLSLPKKSMGVSFSGKFGGETLDCDIFDSGVSSYSNLSIRAGQDYTTTIVRNELMQELCLELSDSAPTQNSKYCVLYINGEYWGIYCLKEDVSRGWYAGITGVDKSSVLKSRSPAGTDSPIREFLDWCYSADMTDPDNYARFCESFDEDALIDWIVMEGYSGNTDINGNMKYFQSSSGKWKIAYYDLDWSLLSTNNAFNTLLNSGDRLQVYTCIIKPLLKNEQFKEKLCRRAAEALSTVLSDEHATDVFDRLVAEVTPEVAADRARWGSSVTTWENRCARLRSQIIDTDYDRICLSTLLKLTKVSDELKAELLAMIN